MYMGNTTFHTSILHNVLGLSFPTQTVQPYSITFRALTLRQRETNYYDSRLSDEGPPLETLSYNIRIGSTPTFLYFDLYLYSAYAAHYVYISTIIYEYFVVD